MSVGNTGIYRLKLLQHTMEELTLECFEEEEEDRVFSRSGTEYLLILA